MWGVGCTVPQGVSRVSDDFHVVGASFPYRFDGHLRRPFTTKNLSQTTEYSLHSALQKLWAESSTS